MTRKRSYGEGSITQRKDGRWQVSVPGIDGKRRYGYADSQKDAEKLRRQILLEVEQGKQPQSKQLFQVHVKEWLEMKKRSGGKPSAYISAESRMSGRFVPAFGHIPLNRLTPAHIQKLYHQWLDEGLSPNTIGHYHATLKICLDTAVRQRKIETNPANYVELPKRKKPKNGFLHQEEATKLLEAVKDHKLFGVLVPLAIATEARLGELLALTWDDIDLDRGMLSINKTLSKDVDDRTSLLEVPPKSESGKRDILLPAFAIQALHVHRSSQRKSLLAAGKKNRLNLVFLLQGGKRDFYWPDTVSGQFSRYAKKLGFDITFHGLRHTGATLLLEAGVDANTVKERLGHSTISITLGTYGHVTRKMRDKSVDALNTLFTDDTNGKNEAI